MSEETTIEPDVKQEADTQVENNVPISRLNEVINERNSLREALESFKSKEEEERRAKLREGALAQLPENKREKFANVDTEVLLSIVEEFTNVEVVNPPDNKGTIPTKQVGDWTEMSGADRRKNWNTILESYMKR